jgi:hypothetical protein
MTSNPKAMPRKKQSKTWEEVAVETVDTFIPDGHVVRRKGALTITKYETMITFTLEQYKEALIDSLMSDLDINVLVLARIKRHIENCKPKA